MNNSHDNCNRNHMNGIFLQIHMFRSRYRSLCPTGCMQWIILLLWEFLCIRDTGRRGSFPFNRKFQKFRLVGTDHFGLVLPEYWGPALNVVHFDRSGYLVRSDPAPMHLIPRHQEVLGKLKKYMVHPRFLYRPTGRCLTKTILYEWFKKFAHCLETLKCVKHSHSFLSFNIYWPCK